MKKKLLLVVLFAAGSFHLLFAGQTGESWARLYRRIPDIKQRYAIIQNLVPLDDQSLEPFYTSALDELVYGDYSQYRTNRSTYDDWEILTRTIIMELGDIKGQSAAPIIWDVVKTAKTPLLKSAGLQALGVMRAEEYAPEIAIMLRNLNFNTSSDKNAAEIEAYGAVAALDKMKAEVGFEPLFYASVGWYHDRVADYAKNAVLDFTEDPVPLLKGIMQRAQSYKNKRTALAFAMESSAPAQSKADIAAAALEEGLKYSESDFTLKRQLADLRVDAMKDLITLDIFPENAPDLLSKAVDEGELDEKLVALQALGADGSDRSAEILASKLSFYNERQINDLTLNNEELLIVRQLIFSLGESGNEKGLQPLQEMKFADYTPSLLRMADQAMTKIRGNK